MYSESPFNQWLESTRRLLALRNAIACLNLENILDANMIIFAYWMSLKSYKLLVLQHACGSIVLQTDFHDNVEI